MNKEFKKNFFTCLLAVLLVVSNLLCRKFTNFLGLNIGVDFITFPFTFLCTLLIVNLGDKKDAYRSILSASVIQLLITISYTIAINLESHGLVSNEAMYINEVFKVNQFNVLSSVLAFILSHCLLIYIYDIFKRFNKELSGVVVGLLASLFLNSVIFLSLTLREYDFMFIIDVLLGNVIINIFMIIIITLIFYLLKDKKEIVVIKEDSNEIKDLGIEEVISNKTKVNKTSNKNKTNNKKNYCRNNNNNNKSSKAKSNVKKSENKKSTSKKNVNKENK